MTRIFKVTQNVLHFSIDTKAYPMSAILKTAYIFIEKYYIFLSLNGSELLVDMKRKDGVLVDESDAGEFYNELLNQILRVHIYQNTKNIRELILGRALHQTCIEIESSAIIETPDESSFNIDEIAEDWFAQQEDI